MFIMSILINVFWCYYNSNNRNKTDFLDLLFNLNLNLTLDLSLINLDLNLNIRNCIHKD